MHTHICILLVLFLWNTQTNTDFGAKSSSKGTECKGEFSELVLGFLDLAL